MEDFSPLTWRISGWNCWMDCISFMAPTLIFLTRRLVKRIYDRNEVTRCLFNWHVSALPEAARQFTAFASSLCWGTNIDWMRMTTDSWCFCRFVDVSGAGECFIGMTRVRVRVCRFNVLIDARNHSNIIKWCMFQRFNFHSLHQFI